MATLKTALNADLRHAEWCLDGETQCAREEQRKHKTRSMLAGCMMTCGRAQALRCSGVRRMLEADIARLSTLVRKYPQA